MRLEIWHKIGLSVFAQHYALVVVHATIGLDWIGIVLTAIVSIVCIYLMHTTHRTALIFAAGGLK